MICTEEAKQCTNRPNYGANEQCNGLTRTPRMFCCLGYGNATAVTTTAMPTTAMTTAATTTIAT